MKIGDRVAGGRVDNVTTLALNGLEMCLVRGIWYDSRRLTPLPEPKLFICDHAEECPNEKCCHICAHPKGELCDVPSCRSRKFPDGAKCIPYVEAKKDCAYLERLQWAWDDGALSICDHADKCRIPWCGCPHQEPHHHVADCQEPACRGVKCISFPKPEEERDIPTPECVYVPEFGIWLMRGVR